MRDEKTVFSLLLTERDDSILTMLEATYTFDKCTNLLRKSGLTLDIEITLWRWVSQALIAVIMASLTPICKKSLKEIRTIWQIWRLNRTLPW